VVVACLRVKNYSEANNDSLERIKHISWAKLASKDGGY
jgi:hypothetical protein